MNPKNTKNKKAIKKATSNEDRGETVAFDMLSSISQANAEWEVTQRNKVGKHQGVESKALTVDNSLFYRNGVFAHLKS